MSNHDEDTKAGPNRRRVLECMAWAGTGMVWTVAGGAPSSRLLGSAQAKDLGFTFVQISDSHIGFDKPVNPDAAATLNEALDKIAALPAPPDFIIHTGDITHLAAPEQFDIALQSIGRLKRDVHYAPGEHDILDAATAKAYMERFGKGARDGGVLLLRPQGRAFRFAEQCRRPENQRPRLSRRGPARLARRRSARQDRFHADRRVLPYPAVDHRAGMGLGHRGFASGAALLARFGSLTVLNGHIHQVMQKIEGAATFHTARSTAFPQPAPGTAPAPGPLKVPPGQLRSLLGITDVVYAPGKAQAGDHRQRARGMRPAMTRFAWLLALRRVSPRLRPHSAGGRRRARRGAV